MAATPHDEGLRWLAVLVLPLFAGGVAWLVKHLLGRKAQVVQLGLQRAQTAEIRAKIRREDESAAVANLNVAIQALKDSVGSLKDERDYWKGRAEKAERYLLEQSLRGEIEDGKG